MAFVVFKSAELISDLLEQFAKIFLKKIATDSHNTSKYAWKLSVALHQLQLSKNLDVTNKKNVTMISVNISTRNQASALIQKSPQMKHKISPPIFFGIKCVC